MEDNDSAQTHERVWLTLKHQECQALINIDLIQSNQCSDQHLLTALELLVAHKAPWSTKKDQVQERTSLEVQLEVKVKRLLARPVNLKETSTLAQAHILQCSHKQSRLSLAGRLVHRFEVKKKKRSEKETIQLLTITTQIIK